MLLPRAFVWHCCPVAILNRDAVLVHGQRMAMAWLFLEERRAWSRAAAAFAIGWSGRSRTMVVGRGVSTTSHIDCAGSRQRLVMIINTSGIST
jgi:hypothetical protein